MLTSNEVAPSEKINKSAVVKSQHLKNGSIVFTIWHNYYGLVINSFHLVLVLVYGSWSVPLVYHSSCGYLTALQNVSLNAFWVLQIWPISSLSLKIVRVCTYSP